MLSSINRFKIPCIGLLKIRATIKQTNNEIRKVTINNIINIISPVFGCNKLSAGIFSVAYNKTSFYPSIKKMRKYFQKCKSFSNNRPGK